MEDTGEDEHSAYQEARKRGYIGSKAENSIRHRGVSLSAGPFPLTRNLSLDDA